MAQLWLCTLVVVSVLSPPGIEMEIVNSCEKNNGGCSHHCEHTTNGPLCSCNHGYQLDQDRKTCVGKNLSLRCSHCLVLFLFLSFSSICLLYATACLPACLPASDSDECASGESCCSHFCRNNPGGYECSCRAGYTLHPDGCGCDGKTAGFVTSLPSLVLWSTFLLWHRKQNPRTHSWTNCSAEMRLFRDHFSEEKKKQNILLEQTFRNPAHLDRRGICNNFSLKQLKMI